MNLTAPDQALLRQPDHKTSLYLSIYRPKTIMSARVTGSFQIGETDVNYYSVSTGTWQNTYPNMQVLVGTTQGGSERGRIRMRASTGTYAVFAENNIHWQHGDYLTFVDYVNVEAIYPKIISDPNNAENVIFYKDEDIPYTNQNLIYGTFPCAGSHRAGFIETGSVSMYFTATGTYNVSLLPLTYSWAFEGGTPTGSTLLTPGNVSWNTPGHYKVRLITTSSNGAVDTTYRYVSVYDKPYAGNNPPIVKWNLEDFSGTRDQGGYTAKIKTWQGLDSVEPNALVVIFSEDWYGSTKKSLGGNGQNNSSIFFVGYILKDTIHFNYKEGYAEFDAGSITEVMKLSEGFSVSCESVVTPSTWFQLENMTINKALYHYLRWHSTVLNVADFQYTGDNRFVQYFDSDRTSLYDAINSFIQEGLIGEVVADRQGKIWAEISHMGYEDPMTSIPAGPIIQKQDWMGEPDITMRRTTEVSFVELGGIAYQGAVVGTWQAILTNAPSFTPYYRGTSERPYEGLILLSQSQLNQLGGNYLANKNSQFEDITLSMRGNWRNLDIAPQERLFPLIDSGMNVLGASTIGYPFRIQSMNWMYDAHDGFLYPDISLEQIATGTAGATLIIPPVPPTLGYEYPGLSLPPLPSFPSTPPVEQLSTTVVIRDHTLGLLYTNNFDDSSPDWLLWNFGISALDISQIQDFWICSNGSVWVATSATTRGWNGVYYAPYIGGQFTKIIDQTWLDGSEGSGAKIYGFGVNPAQPEQVAMIILVDSGGGPAPGHFWIGDHSSFAQKVSFDPATNFTGGLTFGEEKWVWDWVGSADEKFYRFNYDGSAVEYSSPSFGQGLGRHHIRAGTTATILKMRPPITQSGDILRSDDNVNTVIPIVVPDGFDSGNNSLTGNLTCDPTGVFMMGNWSAGNRGRSADGGFSWSGLPNLPFGGFYTFAYAGGSGTGSRWIAARGVIRLSRDFGNTWENREGNISQIIPVGMAITRARAVVRDSDGFMVQS